MAGLGDTINQRRLDLMLVTGPDIVKWTLDRLEGYDFDNPVGVCIIKHERLVGAVVYDNYRPDAQSINVSIALDDKRTLTRDLLKQLFHYPFEQLNCKRMVALIDTRNTPSITLCRRLGFVQEGVLRKAGFNDTDLAIFAMLRDECTWLTLKTSKDT